MRSGQLRHTIAIQESTPTADGMGGSTVAWTTVSGMGLVRAAIWPLNSAERLDAMKLESKTTYRIRIRYRSGITSKMRVYWSDKDKTFNIVGAPTNLDERNRWLEFLATEDA